MRLAALFKIDWYNNFFFFFKLLDITNKQTFHCFSFAASNEMQVQNC